MIAIINSNKWELMYTQSACLVPIAGWNCYYEESCFVTFTMLLL